MRVRPFFCGLENLIMQQFEFYLERAAEARASAGAATLDNVRERWLLSEASWTDMAVRSERNEKLRAKLIAEKASERADAKAASEARMANAALEG